MRPSIAALAGLFLSATLLGCGGSATIPEPPPQVKAGPPPGSSPEMEKPASKAGSPPGGPPGAAKPPG